MKKACTTAREETIKSLDRELFRWRKLTDRKTAATATALLSGPDTFSSLST